MEIDPPSTGPALSDLVEQWHAQRPDLDLTAFRLVGAVMQLAQLLEAEFRELAQSRFGIASGDLRILMALRRADPPHVLRPTDLFRSLLVSSGAITKQVDRLAETGHVKRVLPKGALRRHVIALTPKGKRAADAAQDAIATSLAGIAPTFAGLQPSQVATTLDCLERLLKEASGRRSGGDAPEDEDAAD